MTPSPVPWERVKEVFHEALLLPVAERAAFLAGTGEAEAEVRSLVESHEQASGFLGFFAVWCG